MGMWWGWGCSQWGWCGDWVKADGIGWDGEIFVGMGLMFTTVSFFSEKLVRRFSRKPYEIGPWLLSHRWRVDKYRFR